MQARGKSQKMHYVHSSIVTYVFKIPAFVLKFCLNFHSNPNLCKLDYNNISSIKFKSPFFLLVGLQFEFFYLSLLFPFIIWDVFVFLAPYFFAVYCLETCR